MNIVYTEYAEDTINDRKIDKDLVEKAILEYDKIVKGKKERLIAHKIFGDKLLRVVFEFHKKTYIVITAYYTKPGRYIKNENKF